MQNTTTTIIAILVAGILIFIVPLVTLTDRRDDVTQENVKLIVQECVTEVTNTGKFTREMYQNLINELDATGNTYDIEIEIKRLDENEEKKTAQTNRDKIGENLYYSEYTTQVLKQIGIKVDEEAPSSADTILLKRGDYIYLEVKNDNSTTAQTLKSSFIGFANAGEYAIFANSSGMVTVNGINDKN